MPQSHLLVLERQLAFTPDTFDLWARMPYWSVEEALKLTCGSPGAVESSCSLIREFVLRAKEVGWLSDPVKPLEFVKWMRARELLVPEALASLVLCAHNDVPEGSVGAGSSEAELAHAKEAFQYYKAKATRLNAEIAGLKARISHLEEAAQVVLESSGNSKSRSSLLKLVGGMAMAIYNYDPEAGRSEVVSQIQNDLDLKGVILDADTIRKHVREGARLAKAAAEGVSKPK